MQFVKPEKMVQQLGIQPGMNVADFGAGSGHYTLSAARLVGNAGRVYAIDIQRELVAKVKSKAQQEKLENVEVVWGDLEKEEGSKIKSNSIDLIIASNILFQVKDTSALIDEMARVLKTGGRVAVIDWSESFGGLGPSPDNVVDSEEAQKLFEEHDFSIDRVLDPGAHHYGFIARYE